MVIKTLLKQINWN